MPRDRSWRDPVTVIHIYDAACLIVERMRGVSCEQFMNDVEKQDMVVLRIMVIGEATKRLSEEFRRKHAHIPWAKIASMRNVLVHDYDQWNLEEVWRVATTDVPQLQEQIEPLLPPRPSEG